MIQYKYCTIIFYIGISHFDLYYLNSNINLKQDLKKGIDRLNYGFIVERETPSELINEKKDAIDLYSTIAILWKAVQEQNEELNKLKETI
ncbi:hypothetical protein [Konateibacter massiliensis]|uniref:hypothetical protein n=1 Tax=Konateibacter massiliensis TaxID=2002841 RepID=UPI000C15263C|nr:hypothetical protein [Konateibacter massiliensis]